MRILPLLALLLAGDWHGELERLMEKCYRDHGLNSVERDPCRFVCEDERGRAMWIHGMSESVCRGLP